MKNDEEEYYIRNRPHMTGFAYTKESLWLLIVNFWERIIRDKELLT